MTARLIFMGTPDFAVPSLSVLADATTADNLLVVTQPDRASGRGRRLHAPPIKRHAELLGLGTIQVESLRDPPVRARLTSFAPDAIVVAAFGVLLPKWVLDIPSRGCVNLHASLLPRFRGASPIPAAILCGDRSTGVALMQMERGLDTGAVYAFREEMIRHNDTTESLAVRLADVAASLLANHLADLLGGTISARPQRGTIVETRKIMKAHGAVDWNRRAIEIERHVRAMWPWPRAWAIAESDVRLQIHEVTIAGTSRSESPGVLAHEDGNVLVATSEGWLRLQTVQLPGKSPQRASDLLQHPALAEGTRLGTGTGFEGPEPWIVTAGESS